MDKEELGYWLAWNRVPGIGPARFYKLLDEFGNMADAWNASSQSLQVLIGAKGFKSWQETRKQLEIDAELRQAEQKGFRIYCFSDPAYPGLLKKIPDPPPVLYCRGCFEHDDDVAVAVVGTRNPTPVGAFHSKKLASQLSAQGLTIISGMARGIDSEAHRGALESGGRTIAVLGSGLDVCYPKENRELMEKIAASGAVISEFPLGTPPLAKNFPARNRIISGLSLGVIVVEASEDSGSLITADFALEQGREVFAMPGNVDSEGSKGPHKLIRQGAKLIETYRDVLSELILPYLAEEEIKNTETHGLTPAEAEVYQNLTREPVHIDEITRATGLGTAQISSILIQLELEGLVKKFPGQLYLKLR